MYPRFKVSLKFHSHAVQDRSGIALPWTPSLQTRPQLSTVDGRRFEGTYEGPSSVLCPNYELTSISIQGMGTGN
jgi:hypothetical protein